VSKEAERVCTLASRASTEEVGKSVRKPTAVKRRVASSSLVRSWMVVFLNKQLKVGFPFFT
jgi:hypothetical protein